MIRSAALSGVALGLVMALGLYMDVQPRYVAPGAILGPLARTPVLGLIEYRIELDRLADIARDQQAEIDALLVR